MAEDSDGTLQAVVICEGDLHDPEFPTKFRSLLGQLKSILDPPKRKKRFLKVKKVEPWNSVRITLSIPKDAASKLRQLAAEGNSALRALGILSVQLEGDSVISLRLVGQEIVLRTENENAQVPSGQSRNAAAAANDFTNLLARVPTPQNNQQSQQLQTVCASGGEGTSGLTLMKQQQIVRSNSTGIDPSTSLTNGPIDTKSIFKSPNTICPMDGKLPTPVPQNVIDSREYPFESMTQARVIHRRENTQSLATQSLPVATQNANANPNSNPNVMSSPPYAPFGSPPPPYPNKASPTRNANLIGPHLVSNKVALNPAQASAAGNIAISSPLLVNLLQNESPTSSGSASKILSTNTSSTIGPQTILSSNASTAIVKNGQEIVILSNNSMPHQSPQQANQPPNFLVAPTNNCSGTEIGFNKSAVNKQAMQTQHSHQQMRAPPPKFVNVAPVPSTSESIQQQQTLMHNNNNSSNNNSNINNNNNNNNNNSNNNNINNNSISSNSERSINNNNNNNNNNSVLSAVPQQQANNIVIAGNATVPSNITNVNKIQSRYPQQQQPIPIQSPMPAAQHPQQQYQQFANQSQMRPPAMPSAPNGSQNQPPQILHPNQPMPNILPMQQAQLNASPQSMPAQVILQKQQQLRAMHPNMVGQPGLIRGQFTEMRGNEFRHPAPTMMQPNQMQTHPMQQFQQAAPLQSPQMMQQTPVSGTQMQFGAGSQQVHVQQQQQQQQQPQQQVWPLKPMDSATQSSFQEFDRYQMQYNLSQQQQTTAENDSIADHLADLDEITRTDLESLCTNDTDLYSALGLDIKAPLESLLDAKDLELDLIDPSVNDSTTAAMIGGNENVSQQSTPYPYQPNSQTNLPHHQMPMPQQQHQQQQMQNNFSVPKSAPFSQGDTKTKSHTNAAYTNATMPASLSKQQQLQQQKMQMQHRFESKTQPVAGKEKQVLINPLTGELEPIPSEESNDEFLMADGSAVFNEFNLEASNSIYSDEENSCSTGFSKASDHSDNDRSSNSEFSGKGKNANKPRKERKDSSKKQKTPKEKAPKTSLLKEKLQQGLKEKILGKNKEKNKVKNLSPPIISNASIAEMSDKSNPEKIKLRLKLGKSEPVTSAYKVDVSFGESPKRTLSNPSSAKIVSSTSNTTNTAPSIRGQSAEIRTTGGAQSNSAAGSPASEELRVPPLHISLRGRNHVVIKNSKKGRKKSQSGGEDDDSKKLNSKKSNNTTSTSIANSTSASAESSPLSNSYNRLHHNANENSSGSNLNASQNPTDKSATKSNSVQKIKKQQTGDDLKTENANSTEVRQSPKAIIKTEQPKLPQNASSVSSEMKAASHSESAKRTNCDQAAANGPVHPEKKRRLSQSDSTAISGVKEDIVIASTSTTLVSTSTNSSTKPLMTDSSVESIREAIGSTNVGTLPKHSSLTSTKVQKGNNNNNNSLMLNKVKPVNKLKAKSLINVLKQHSGQQILSNETSAPDEKSDVNAGLLHGKVDAISEEKFKQKLLESANETASNAGDGQYKQSPSTFQVDGKDEDKPSLNETPSPNTTNKMETIPVENTNVAAPASSEPANETSESHSKAMPTTTPNTQYVNIVREVRDSPRRDIIDGILNASQTIRCSPASQAQGEDSGIESMDALSEKSPHQTASPQASEMKRAESPKEVPAKVANVDGLPAKAENISADKYSNIEAALAKMEGLNEFMSSDCDKSSVDADTVCVNEQMNGEHSTIESEKQVELLVNDLVESVKSDKNDTLIDALNSSDDHFANDIKTELVSTVDVVKSETKDMNENQTIVETAIVKDEIGEVPESTENNDSVANQSEKSAIINDEKKINTENCVVELIRVETKPNDVQTHVEEKLPEVKEENHSNAKDEPIVSPVLNEIIENTDTDSKPDAKCEQIKSEEDKEIEETMNAMEVDSNAITNSAEPNAPEILSQLSIEIPANENDNLQRVRTRASSKLESPLDMPKQSPSDSPASGNTKVTGRTSKRKRQGSESSTQSSVSDDMPIRAKKPRRSGGETTTPSSTSSSPTNVTNTPSPSPMTSSNNTNCVNKPGPKRPTVHNKDSAVAINNASYSSETDNSMNRKSEDSSDSDEPLIEVAGKVRNAKIIKDADKILRNHQKAPVANAQFTGNNSTQSSGETPNKNANAVIKADDKSSAMMSTRRSVRMNATSTKITKSAVISQNNHSQSSPTVYTVTLNSAENHSDALRKSGNGTTINAVSVAESPTTAAASTTGDARRKTRSTGLESLSTDGRRRRVSRDK